MTGWAQRGLQEWRSKVRHHTFTLSSAAALHPLGETLVPRREEKDSGEQAVRPGCVLLEEVSCSRREKNLDGEKKAGRKGRPCPWTPQADLIPTRFTLFLHECSWLCQGTAFILIFSGKEDLVTLTTIHFCVQRKRPTNFPVCHFGKSFWHISSLPYLLYFAR